MRSANDVRGRQVKDKKGDGIGKVADLLVDDQEEKVRFLLVEHGGFLGFGETKSLIPVDAVTKITEDDVYVDQSREQVAAAPGYLPYWGPGYIYPGALTLPPMSSPHGPGFGV